MALSDKERSLAGRSLRQAAWFRSAGPAAQAWLFAHARLVRFARGQTVFLRDDPVRDLVEVIEGRLELSMVDAQGRKMTTPPVPPGEMVGLIPLLDGSGALHNASASEASTLLHVPKAALLAAMQADVQFLQAVMQVLVERARRANEWRIHAALQTLESRVAAQLLSLARAVAGPDGLRAPMELRLTQDELAGSLGVSRQTLNSQINALKQQALVRLSYGRIDLLDLAKLEAVARR